MKCSADPITADSSNKHRELDLAVFSEKHESLRCLVTGKIARTRLSVIEYPIIGRKKTRDCKSKICQESCLIQSVCFVIQMMIVVFDFNIVIRNGKFCDGTISWTVFG